MHTTKPGRLYSIIFSQWFLLVGSGYFGFIQVVPHDREAAGAHHGRICSFMHSSSVWSLLCVTGFFSPEVRTRLNHIRISELSCSLSAFELGDSY